MRSKLKYIGLAAVFIFVGLEVTYYLQCANVKTEFTEITFADEYTELVDGVQVVASGPIAADKYASIENISPDNNDNLVLFLKVEIFQLIENSTSFPSEETDGNVISTTNFSYRDGWVEKVETISNLDKTDNPNFERWPLNVKTTNTVGANYLFRKEYELNSEELNEEMLKYYTWPDKLLPIEFSSLKIENKDFHDLEEDGHFYGSDSKNPVYGDVRISLAGLQSKGENSEDIIYSITGTKNGNKFESSHGEYKLKEKDPTLAATDIVKHRMPHWIIPVRILYCLTFLVVFIVIVIKWNDKRKGE